MRIIQFILLGVIFCSCANEDSFANIKNPNGTEFNDSHGTLLRSVNSGQITSIYEYNNDSTLHAIREVWNGETRSESEMVYKNGKVSEIIWQDVSRNTKSKRVFEYNGDLLVKETMFEKNEVVNIHEYFYNDNNQKIKEVQKMEWNNEASKQTRVIEFERVSGKNEIHLKYDGILSFVLTYDDGANPYSKIKGYSTIYTSNFFGISNNLLTLKRTYKNGEESIQKSELTYDSSGKYLIEVSKKGDDQRLICTEIYTYN